MSRPQIKSDVCFCSRVRALIDRRRCFVAYRELTCVHVSAFAPTVPPPLPLLPPPHPLLPPRLLSLPLLSPHLPPHPASVSPATSASCLSPRFDFLVLFIPILLFLLLILLRSPLLFAIVHCNCVYSSHASTRTERMRSKTTAGN